MKAYRSITGKGFTELAKECFKVVKALIDIEQLEDKKRYRFAFTFTYKKNHGEVEIEDMSMFSLQTKEEFMEKHGLGPEDMIDDITYP